MTTGDRAGAIGDRPLVRVDEGDGLAASNRVTRLAKAVAIIRRRNRRPWPGAARAPGPRQAGGAPGHTPFSLTTIIS
jgi:hypothetical protein